MTSITIVRGENAIAIASDGAAYDDGGVLRQITSKVELLPHLSLVVAVSGAGQASEYFRQLLFWSVPAPRNFDEVLTLAPDIARDVKALVDQDRGSVGRDFSLYLCGYSESRDRAETYGLKSRDWPDVLLPSGDMGKAPPFMPIPLPEIHCSPRPHSEDAERFGIQVPGINMTERPSDGSRYALSAVAATRFALGGADEAQARDDPHYCVGGFLQLTVIARDHVSSQIVHRWPDVVGERIDIERGEESERCPEWLLKPLEESAESGDQASDRL